MLKSVKGTILDLPVMSVHEGAALGAASRGCSVFDARCAVPSSSSSDEDVQTPPECDVPHVPDVVLDSAP